MKNPHAIQEMWVQCPDWDSPLEEGMVTYSTIHTWRMPWTEEPDRLQSIGHKELDMTKVTEHTHRHLDFTDLWSDSCFSNS